MSAATSISTRSAPRPARSSSRAAAGDGTWRSSAPCRTAISIAVRDLVVVRADDQHPHGAAPRLAGGRREPDGDGLEHHVSVLMISVMVTPEAVVDDHHLAARDQAVVDQDVDRLADLAVELDHRAAAEPQQLADRHGGLAEHRRELHRDVVDRAEVVAAAAPPAAGGARRQASAGVRRPACLVRRPAASRPRRARRERACSVSSLIARTHPSLASSGSPPPAHGTSLPAGSQASTSAVASASSRARSRSAAPSCQASRASPGPSRGIRQHPELAPIAGLRGDREQRRLAGCARARAAGGPRARAAPSSRTTSSREHRLDVGQRLRAPAPRRPARAPIASARSRLAPARAASMRSSASRLAASAAPIAASASASRCSRLAVSSARTLGCGLGIGLAARRRDRARQLGLAEGRRRRRRARRPRRASPTPQARAADS